MWRLSEAHLLTSKIWYTYILIQLIHHESNEARIKIELEIDLSTNSKEIIHRNFNSDLMPKVHYICAYVKTPVTMWHGK